MGLQVNLGADGPFLFTSDQYVPFQVIFGKHDAATNTICAPVSFHVKGKSSRHVGSASASS